MANSCDLLLHLMQSGLAQSLRISLQHVHLKDEM